MELNDVYRSIFAVPKLIYVRIISYDWINLKSLPIATTNEQFSTIKYLIIDHYCTFNQLAVILSYTPEFCHLKFRHQPERDSNREMILSNLTHISIKLECLHYDEFVIFIKKISSKLKILHLIIRYEHVIYLVSNLWEQLILQHIPQLEKFSLKFVKFNNNENRSGDYVWQDEQFTSSFWIERKWIFHAEIYRDKIIHSIYPYKKTWYDSMEIDTNSMVSVQQRTDCTSSILTIVDIFYSECSKLLFENIIWVTTITPIYHLQFSQRRIFIPALMKIINFLPNLISLKIWSLSLLKLKRLSCEEIQFINDVTNNNKITKVYLENMIKFKDIISLMNLFPRMKYLQIVWINNIDIDIESFIRINLIKIIKKSNHDLRLLCFCIQMADDQMVKNLQNIIDSKKLLFDYTIKRVCEKIYLKWK